MPSWQGMAASTWQSLSVASHSHLRTHVQRGSHLSKAFHAWVDQEWWNHSHSRSHTPYKVTQLLQGKCRMPAGLVSLISVCLGQLTGSGPQWWIAESVCAVVVWIACFFFLILLIWWPIFSLTIKETIEDSSYCRDTKVKKMLEIQLL